MIDQIIAGFAQQSGWELLAVVFSIAYIVFAAKENIWCWPAAFFSTIIYSWLFFDVNLLMESALNVYYLVMALYGFYCWRKRSSLMGPVNNIEISSWPLSVHLTVIGVLAVISLVVGYLMDNYTSTDFAYLDSATTVFSVFTTWMVARKVLENWLYWVVIDAVSIYLYINKALYATAALFVIYIVIAIIGYWQWQKKLQPTLQIAN